jgi:hypothetical protein
MRRDVEKKAFYLTPRLRDTVMRVFAFHVKQNDHNYLIIRTYAL